MNLLLANKKFRVLYEALTLTPGIRPSFNISFLVGVMF